MEIIIDCVARAQTHRAPSWVCVYILDMYNVLFSPLELNRCWRLRAYISVILKLLPPIASTYVCASVYVCVW